VSLQTEAEAVRDLADKIVRAEIVRAQVTASGGSIEINGNPDLVVALTVAQRQAALAIEAGWQTSIKTIASAW
jgi:hypothetical protein